MQFTQLSLLYRIVASLLACNAFAFPANAQSPAIGGTKPLYKNAHAPIESRVSDLLARLTSVEKTQLFSTNAHGFHVWMIDTPAIDRLGIPPLRTCDAPQGIRVTQSTGFPMGVVMASTWDTALITRLGAALGEEARAVDRQIVYGPSINIQRTPQSGRFFENMSEDPFLTSAISDSYIIGMQSQGVASCPKHFFGNNQEVGRHGTHPEAVSVDMDERTMREIYFPAFYSAVTKAHTWSLMAAVNQINGVNLVSSHQYMTDILKTEWKWDGLLIADWSAMDNTTTQIPLNAGVDMDIPDQRTYSPNNIAQVVADGSVSPTVIDNTVRRVLRCMIRTGRLDDPPSTRPAVVDSPEHREIALKTAEEGITLLKNANETLPLNIAKIKSIAVIGPNAADTQIGGRWSANTPTTIQTSVLDAVQSRAGSITVSSALGCNRIGDTPDDTINEAVAIAAKSDVAIVVVGTDADYMGEEKDPPVLYLPGAQERLIQAVAAANKNTIVVLNNGGPILMNRWLPQVPALLEAWYAGQDQGTAIAAILFGDVNPSGKLAATIANRREDYSDWPNYPGTNGHVKYAEGIFVGYRHFDKENIAPLFPFGYGLSYTTFSYSHISAPARISSSSKPVVHVTVANSGKRAGDEIVELYIHPVKPLIRRPIRELKGFQRISLMPGRQAVVSIPIEYSAFAYWDTTKHRWRVDPGVYEVQIGSSSRDIRQTTKVQVD